MEEDLFGNRYNTAKENMRNKDLKKKYDQIYKLAPINRFSLAHILKFNFLFSNHKISH